MERRSTTHTFTNRTFFSSEELRERLPELVDPRGSLPDALLPTFLHEGTHHWCFTSTVGTTIAIQKMRGTVSAFRAIEATSPEEAKAWEKAAADDLTRAEVAALLLRPLAEGMALFAEFDLSVSQRSPVVPPPLKWAAMFSARDKLTGSPSTRVRRRMDIAQATAIALEMARRSERARRAKEALLIEPLDCQISDGYLAGYLLMKSLWRNFQDKHPRFIEPELFLLKVYSILRRHRVRAPACRPVGKDSGRLGLNRRPPSRSHRSNPPDFGEFAQRVLREAVRSEA